MSQISSAISAVYSWVQEAKGGMEDSECKSVQLNALNLKLWDFFSWWSPMYYRTVQLSAQITFFVLSTF